MWIDLSVKLVAVHVAVYNMLRRIKSLLVVGVTIIAVTLMLQFWQYAYSVKKTISLQADVVVETGPGGTQRSFETIADVAVETGPGGPQRSFALAWSYWEGMTMATFNFMGLVTVAKHWNATTVWPFTNNSYLWGIQDQVNAGRFGFDLIYDLDDVKQKCADASLPPPVSFEEFLESASRRVVAVIIDWKPTGGTTNRCSEVQKNHMNSVINSLNTKAIAHTFRQETCCILYNKDINDGIASIAEKCELKARQPFTVIFDEWRGTTYDHHLDYRLSIPKDVNSKIPVHFKHSESVIGNSTMFLKSITNQTQVCIAVHIRAYVVFRDNTTEKCIVKLNQIFKDLRANYSNLTPILVFGDEKLIQIQDRIEADVVRFPSTIDPGFTGQVEQHAMSLCKILVLAGAGSFQYRILARFNDEPSHLFSIRAC